MKFYLSNISRIVKAIISNFIARFFPGYYVRMTGQTGRGSDVETPASIGDYYKQCFDDYCRQLNISPGDENAFFHDKEVLEYGPGDIPGVALLMIAHGAQRVRCVDRFPLLSMKPFNIEVLEYLLSQMTAEMRERADKCFVQPGVPASGLNQERVHYLVTKDGLLGESATIDLVISRAVMEHVNDLEATITDMSQVLKAGGMAAHLVDLKSHGLHIENPLDFLRWPDWLWFLMYGYKGVPNRYRVNQYRAVLAGSKLSLITLEATQCASQTDVEAIRNLLPKKYNDINNDDLSWLGFWLVARNEMEA